MLLRALCSGFALGSFQETMWCQKSRLPINKAIPYLLNDLFNEVKILVGLNCLYSAALRGYAGLYVQGSITPGIAHII